MHAIQWHNRDLSCHCCCQGAGSYTRNKITVWNQSTFSKCHILLAASEKSQTWIVNCMLLLVGSFEYVSHMLLTNIWSHYREYYNLGAHKWNLGVHVLLNIRTWEPIFLQYRVGFWTWLHRYLLSIVLATDWGDSNIFIRDWLGDNFGWFSYNLVENGI